MQPVRLRAASPEAEQAPEQACDQQRDAPAAEETRAGGHDAFLRRRQGRFEITVGRLHQVEVAVARRHPEALERTRVDERLAMALEALQTLDVAAHGGALTADEIVRIRLQPADCGFAAVAVGAGISLEALHNPA